LALGRLVFNPIQVQKVLAEWHTFVKDYGQFYQADLSDQGTSKAIVYYFATFLPKHLQTLLDNPASRRFVKNALGGANEGAAEPQGVSAFKIAPPWFFMDEYKRENPSIHYVGTFYPGNFKAAAIPIDAMRRIPAIKEKVDAAAKRLSAAAANLAGAILTTKIRPEPAAGQTKVSRVIRWIRERPSIGPKLTDFKTADRERRAAGTTLFESLQLALTMQNLEFEQYLDICDAFHLANSQLSNSRNALLAALKKAKTGTTDIEKIRREGSGDDARLLLAWEDFGCGMASRSALEFLSPDPEILRTIQTDSPPDAGPQSKD
jgi:hypothetical protein